MLGRIEAEEPWTPAKTAYVAEHHKRMLAKRDSGTQAAGDDDAADEGGGGGGGGHGAANERLAAIIKKVVAPLLSDMTRDMAKEIALLKQQVAASASS